MPYIVICIAYFYLKVFQSFITFFVDRLSLQVFWANRAIINDTRAIFWKRWRCWNFPEKKREIMCKKSELTKTVSNQHNQNTMKHYVLVAIYYLLGKHSGRLLHFWTLRVGTYLRWVLTWSWMDIEFPPFSASSKCPFDRVPTLCLGGDGFDSCHRFYRFCPCPTLVSWWLVHFSQNVKCKKTILTVH